MAIEMKEIANLKRIIALAEKTIRSAAKNGNGTRHGKRRIRRSGSELVQFRKMLKAERKKGVPVATIARKHNVSSAYIYQI
jgi:hypothetical protein